MPSPGTGVGIVTSVIWLEKYQIRLPDGSYERTMFFPVVMISVRRSFRHTSGVDHALTSSRSTRQF